MFTEEQLAFMERNVFFKDLDDPRAQTFPRFALQQYKKGDVIFRPGTEPQKVFFLLHGNVRFDISTQKGGESFIEIAHSGYFFGDLEVITGFDYRSSATAYEDSAVAAISKKDFLQLLSSDSVFLLNYNRQLATNFYYYQIVTAEREVSDLRIKLANLLWNLSSRFGDVVDDQIELNISQEELSDMLNASRQRINKQISEWQKQSVLSSKYGKIRIFNKDALAREASLGGMSLDSAGIAPTSKR